MSFFIAPSLFFKKDGKDKYYFFSVKPIVNINCNVVYQYLFIVSNVHIGVDASRSADKAMMIKN